MLKVTTLVILATAVSPVVAFAPSHARIVRTTPLFSSQKDVAMPVIVTGNNVEVTDALVEYATKKVAKVVAKHRELVTKAEVHMTVTHNPSVPDKFISTATLAVKGGVIRDSTTSENMYASLDHMSDVLGRKLRKYKERLNNKLHDNQGSAFREGYNELVENVEEEGDTAGDEYADTAEEYAIESVVKQKSFNMDPMSVEEAALCLDYIDHSFYVFRNSASGEISVLYKRNSGGLGLIEPGK